MRRVEALRLLLAVVVAAAFHPVRCGRSGAHQETVQLASGNVKVRDCEPITVQICRANLAYNATASPNLVGHGSQVEAEHELNTFKPLLQYGCSSRLSFFLCSAYVPLCTEKVQQVIGPCRPLCEDVRQRCEPVLNQFGFPWLQSLNCSRFPPQNDQNHMCMEGPAIEDDDEVPTPSTVTRPPPVDAQRWVRRPLPPASNVVHLDAAGTSGTDCSRMRNAPAYVYVNRTKHCSLLCHESDSFTVGEKNFAEVWMAVWSILCFISTLFTVFSFLIDSSRFRYPERAIVIIAFCYNIVSVGYMTRLLAGREAVACAVVDTPAGPRSVLVDSAVDQTDCKVVFLLIYFFSMASCVWWVLLTLLWFLAAGLLWTREAIERHAGVLHVVAWTPPAIQTVAVLIDRSVDADELTAVCHVGGTARSRLLLVIAPLAAFLVAGAAFLVAGFVSLCRVRRSVRRSGVETDRLEALMVRIGIFSLLYVVPAAVALACYCHEHAARNSDGQQLSSAVLMVKVVCSLIVGTTSGMWIWSAKTLQAWKSLFDRIRCRRRVEQSSKVATVSGLLPRPTQAPCKGPERERPPHHSSGRHPFCRQCNHQHHHYYHHHHSDPQTDVQNGRALLSNSKVYDDSHLSNQSPICL